jgi:hypothetical protein
MELHLQKLNYSVIGILEHLDHAVLRTTSVPEHHNKESEVAVLKLYGRYKVDKSKNNWIKTVKI